MAVPALVMLALGLWRLDRGGMWRDEAVSFQVGRRTVPQIWRLLHDVDAVHGLYYLLVHAVLAVRPGEVALRLPSVCAAAGTAALVAALGARLLRPRAGLWAGLLYAVTPMAGHYAQEGRSYALVAAGATAATLLFTRAVRGGAWWPYGAVLALTCWLHEFAVLLLLAHAGSLALARAGGRVWRAWGGTAAAVVLALLPMALVSRGQAAQLAWLRAPTGDTVEGLLRKFLGPADPVFWVCLVLGVLGLAGLVGRKGELTCAGVGLPVMVVPPAVLMLVSQLSPLYVDRYVLYALSGAPLLVACGAERLAGALGRLPAGTRRLPAHAAPHGGGSPGGGLDGGALHGGGPRGGALRDGGPRDCAPHGSGLDGGALHGGGPHGGAHGGGLEGGGLGGGEPRGGGPHGGGLDGGALHGGGPRGGALHDGGPRGCAPHGGGLEGGAPHGGALHGGAPCGGGSDAGPGGRGRSRGVALVGVLAVSLVLVHQFPLLRLDRDPGRRPDDLAAVSRAAGREVGAGEAVVFVPAALRNAALAYPRPFRDTRDVLLVTGAAQSGTLYGREAGVAEARRRLAGLDRVWVVGDRRLLGGAWVPRDPVERAKAAVLWQQFTARRETVRGWVTVRLYVRPVSAPPPSAPPRSVPPPSAPPRPARP